PCWITLTPMFKLLGSCLFLFASAVLAQTPDTATIQGQVTDPSRAAVPGVRVAARNQQTGLERTALTDGAGNYSLAGLPVAGSYQIAATRQGFADAQVKDVTLAGGATASIDLQLRVSGGQTQFSTLPVSAVAEMSVLANAFSAEYGATVGGVINIVTKSGGSAFHGER